MAKKLSGINIKSETIRNMYNIIDVIVYYIRLDDNHKDLLMKWNCNKSITWFSISLLITLPAYIIGINNDVVI